MKRIVFGCLWMALAATALAQTSHEKLGPGDTVHITVFQQPDLTTDARVNEQGTIAMPLVGQVKVGGITTSEAATKIADALKEGRFLKSPQVAMTLTTVRSRQVSILGLVVRPGRYPLAEGSPRIPDLIAEAGGIAAGGSESVTVIRDGQPQAVHALSKDFHLKGGDTVVIERAPVFYIYGEVVHAGAYPVGQNLTVMQAISLGGGITPRGSENRVKLRRTQPGGNVVEKDAKLTETVQPNDVIFVKESIF
jgi:polysaccharide biosynthesis/export protein